MYFAQLYIQKWYSLRSNALATRALTSLIFETMARMQNDLLLDNGAVAEGQVSGARGAFGLQTAAGEDSFTRPSYREGLPMTDTRI